MASSSTNGDRYQFQTVREFGYAKPFGREYMCTFAFQVEETLPGVERMRRACLHRRRPPISWLQWALSITIATADVSMGTKGN